MFIEISGIWYCWIKERNWKKIPVTKEGIDDLLRTDILLRSMKEIGVESGMEQGVSWKAMETAKKISNERFVPRFLSVNDSYIRC